MDSVYLFCKRGNSSSSDQGVELTNKGFSYAKFCPFLIPYPESARPRIFHLFCNSNSRNTFDFVLEKFICLKNFPVDSSPSLHGG